MSKSTDLKIRVISNLSTTQQVLLYQQDIQTNVKNFLTAAWEHPQVAPRSQYDVTLPLDIAIGSDIIASGMTKNLGAAPGIGFERLASAQVAKPPKLYVGLSGKEIQGDSIDAAALSAPPVAIDYEGHQHVTVHLEEDVNGGVKITYDFGEFE